MRHTQLIGTHRALGAKLMDFHGWEMPLEYSGVVHEHEAVRNAAGLFDLGHMGVIEVGGADCIKFLAHMFPTRPDTMEVDSVRYTFLLNESGGILDDLMMYRLTTERYLLVVNCANREKDISWLKGHAAGYDAILVDDSPDTAILALQGPASWDIVKGALGIDPASFKYGRFINSTFEGTGYILSKSGYTGEKGFEIYIHNHTAERMWETLMEAGERYGLMPCGLGARDTLRLEMGFLLSGADADEGVNPIEAGYARSVDFDNKTFIGRAALEKAVKDGPKRRLVGLKLAEKGVPRHGCRILAATGQVGIVTSGNFSPMLKAGIAIGYIASDAPLAGLSVEIHDKPHAAEVVDLPFYRKK